MAAAAATEVPAATAEMRITDDVRESIERVAVSQGSEPAELLVRAWNEYVENHRDVLTSESKQVRQMLRENDREALAAYVNRRGRERAKQAAARIKR
jgi:hypothetical protein